MENKDELIKNAEQILDHHWAGHYTMPSPLLYPHQWLWDSCFIAIGLRHFNISHAQEELRSLTRGQWKNGMQPQMIFGDRDKHYYGDRLFHSRVNRNSPGGLRTSGITQPPMLAEAVWQVGQKLDDDQRRDWYKEMLPHIIRFHTWLYDERDPRGEGLVLLVHPWESGLDNSPPWSSEMRKNQTPRWIRIVNALRLSFLLEFLRRDTRHVPADERADTTDVLTMFSIARRLRRKRYVTKNILRHSPLSVIDLSFNSILIRANKYLITMADEIGEKLPPNLWESLHKAPHALELLWSEDDQQYFSRNYDNFELIKEPSIACLLPLYAGTISKTRAAHLVDALRSHDYWLKYPVPSTPRNSSYFSPGRYWQGPTWINTNWLIIEGLKNYGYTDLAAELSQKTLDLVQNSGFSEYFSPLDGRPVGVKPFSWTAALTIDILNQR